MPATDKISPADENRLLRLRDVAELMQCSEKLVRNLTIKGGLRFVRLGRAIRFKRAWVDAYIEKMDRGR